MKKLILLLLIAQFSFSQTNFEAYLKANKHEIKSDTDKFEIFDSEFYKNQIFLFGENHGSSNPHDIDFLLFKHLHKTEKIRHYIAEVDPTKAWMLNNYLKDGNENWLVKIFKSWKNEGAQWANKSNWEKYKKLHQFYISLPTDEKFTIIGIDVIQDYSLLTEYIKESFNNKISKIDLINQFVTTSDTVNYKNRKIMGSLARKIELDMQTNNLYKKELKENFTNFKLFIKNAGYVGNKMFRDSIMFRTFDDVAQLTALKNKKMYGFLGFYHCLQTSYEKSFPFASYLKNNKTYNGVVSLQMLALNCKVLLPYNDQIKKIMPAAYAEQLRKDNPDFPITDKYIPFELSNDNPMMQVDGIDDLRTNSNENATTIFKLNAKNTPFFSSKKLAEVTGFQSMKITNLDNITLDAFQYVILFRNSPAGIPILD
jgi:uncharacterized iron-regulated protein